MESIENQIANSPEPLRSYAKFLSGGDVVQWYKEIVRLTNLVELQEKLIMPKSKSTMTEGKAIDQIMKILDHFSDDVQYRISKYILRAVEITPLNAIDPTRKGAEVIPEKDSKHNC